MMKALLAALSTALLLTACATLAPVTVPNSHPEKLTSRPVNCVECHDQGIPGVALPLYNHTAAFAQGGHKDGARAEARLCSMCHRANFCEDCHGVKSELKPSDRRNGQFDRVMPHRGDYRSRHQIDGRLDPASCFSCHGNPKSSATCVRCHGK